MHILWESLPFSCPIMVLHILSKIVKVEDHVKPYQGLRKILTIPALRHSLEQHTYELKRILVDSLNTQMSFLQILYGFYSLVHDGC